MSRRMAASLFEQPALMHGLHVTEHVLGAGGHRAVDPGADLDFVTALQVACKVGRNLQCQTQFAAAHAAVQFVVIGDGRLGDEVARAAEVERIVVAEHGLVAVEHGEAQVFDIHADAVAERDHQKQRAEQRYRSADGVAAQFQRLADRVAEQAQQAEAGVRRSLFLLPWRERERGDASCASGTSAGASARPLASFR